MAANGLELIVDRVNSLCIDPPFNFHLSVSQFDFDLQPDGLIDGSFRIESEGGRVVGGFNFIEDRTDLLHIWVARKHLGDSLAMYRQLLTDARSVRAAVVRDGVQNGGDYGVPDNEGGLSVQHDAGQEYAVLRLTVPVNYETDV